MNDVMRMKMMNDTITSVVLSQRGELEETSERSRLATETLLSERPLAAHLLSMCIVE